MSTARAEREREDAVVEGEVHGEGQLDRAERPDDPPGQDAADDAASDRQHQALGEQMPNELPAGRPDGKAHREILRAGGAAHEQQRREVAARNRQHQPDNDEQRATRSPSAGRPSADGPARRSTRTP